MTIRIKCLGLNGLLLAAAVSCDKDIFDFLLKKGVSAAETVDCKVHGRVSLSDGSQLSILPVRYTDV